MNENSKGNVGIKITLPIKIVEHFEQKGLSLTKVVNKLLDIYMEDPGILDRPAGTVKGGVFDCSER